MDASPMGVVDEVRFPPLGVLQSGKGDLHRAQGLFREVTFN